MVTESACRINSAFSLDVLSMFTSVPMFITGVLLFAAPLTALGAGLPSPAGSGLPPDDIDYNAAFVVYCIQIPAAEAADTGYAKRTAGAGLSAAADQSEALDDDVYQVICCSDDPNPPDACPPWDEMGDAKMPGDSGGNDIWQIAVSNGSVTDQPVVSISPTVEPVRSDAPLSATAGESPSTTVTRGTPSSSPPHLSTDALPGAPAQTMAGFPGLADIFQGPLGPMFGQGPGNVDPDALLKGWPEWHMGLGSTIQAMAPDANTAATDIAEDETGEPGEEWTDVTDRLHPGVLPPEWSGTGDVADVDAAAVPEEDLGRVDRRRTGVVTDDGRAGTLHVGIAVGLGGLVAVVLGSLVAVRLYRLRSRPQRRFKPAVFFGCEVREQPTCRPQPPPAALVSLV